MAIIRTLPLACAILAIALVGGASAAIGCNDGSGGFFLTCTSDEVDGATFRAAESTLGLDTGDITCDFGHIFFGIFYISCTDEHFGKTVSSGTSLTNGQVACALGYDGFSNDCHMTTTTTPITITTSTATATTTTMTTATATATTTLTTTTPTAATTIRMRWRTMWWGNGRKPQSGNFMVKGSKKGGKGGKKGGKGGKYDISFLGGTYAPAFSDAFIEGGTFAPAFADKYGIVGYTFPPAAYDQSGKGRKGGYKGGYKGGKGGKYDISFLGGTYAPAFSDAFTEGGTFAPAFADKYGIVGYTFPPAAYDQSSKGRKGRKGYDYGNSYYYSSYYLKASATTATQSEGTLHIVAAAAGVGVLCVGVALLAYRRYSKSSSGYKEVVEPRAMEATESTPLM